MHGGFYETRQVTRRGHFQLRAAAWRSTSSLFFFSMAERRELPPIVPPSAGTVSVNGGGFRAMLPECAASHPSRGGYWYGSTGRVEIRAGRRPGTPPHGDLRHRAGVRLALSVVLMRLASKALSPHAGVSGFAPDRRCAATATPQYILASMPSIARRLRTRRRRRRRWRAHGGGQAATSRVQIYA